MEYHSIKITLITRVNKTKEAQKQVLQTFNLTEAIIWLQSKLPVKKE